MYRIILLCLLCFIAGGNAFAEIASSDPHSGARINVEFLSLAQPDLHRDQRLMYRGSWRNRLPQLPFLRLDGSLHIAPDEEKKSKRVDISHDLYAASLTAVAEYTKYFRFSAGIGPVLTFERTTIDFASTAKSVDFTDYGLLARGDVDYAFNANYEANFSLAWQSRTRAQKSDWSYGFGFGRNF